MNKWVEYENQKRNLQNTCKTSEEYEIKVKELIKKLKL